ncbi:hypothetical protein [Kiloniella majae]|uniref:hypothetical protein n=1 Tax=Kiloniella majae TaxID=1938558 RepID=UPI000F7984BE|nr:hypothetical protein [Kiloniella majae]
MSERVSLKVGSCGQAGSGGSSGPFVELSVRGKEDYPAEVLYPEHFNTSVLKGAWTLILGEDADSIFVACRYCSLVRTVFC